MKIMRGWCLGRADSCGDDHAEDDVDDYDEEEVVVKLICVCIDTATPILFMNDV